MTNALLHKFGMVERRFLDKTDLTLLESAPLWTKKRCGCILSVAFKAIGFRRAALRNRPGIPFEPSISTTRPKNSLCCFVGV